MPLCAHSALVRRNMGLGGFSLIELLVALSVLAVVAAIIVPQFLNVRAQSAQAVVDQNLAEIASATSMWQSLGGTIDPSDISPAFHTVQFLGQPGNPADPTRGILSIDPYNTCRDSGSSSTVSITVGAGGATSRTVPTAATNPDGFYAQPNPQTTTGIVVSLSPDGLYEKVGNLLTPIDADLATAVFIRTGFAVGESAPTIGVLP